MKCEEKNTLRNNLAYGPCNDKERPTKQQLTKRKDIKSVCQRKEKGPPLGS